MTQGLFKAAFGSLEQQRRLDIIANNIANSSSPGYKKDGFHFSDVLGETTYTNMEQGPIRETGHKTDIALTGSGFLRVQTDKGILYTRAGDLTVNSSKTLVTKDGWPVLSRNGPINIENTWDLRIAEDGQIFDGINPIDKIEIVQFPSGVAMKKIQGGYFTPENDAISPIQAPDCTLRQGALEGANFNPIEEMVKMIEAMRRFETYQKTMQIYNKELDGQIISKLSG